MNKYSQNYKITQKEENPWLVALGALGMFGLIILMILVAGGIQ